MMYLAKGTPPGYDVLDTADYLLSFNSSWPLLKLHETGNFSGTVTHDLGYPPFHLLARPASGIGTNDGRLDQFADEYGVDSSVLARASGSGSPRYFIFRLDLTTNFLAPNIATSTAKSTENDNYVFKVSKPDKDVSSTDMRDFSLHSNTRSPMLHQVDHGSMVNTGAGLGLERTVSHNLGYLPTVFVFMRPGTNTLGLNANRYSIVEPPVGVSGKYFTVTSSSVYITADTSYFSGTPQVSVVILKDPFTKEVINTRYP